MSSCIPSVSYWPFWLYHVNKMPQFRIIDCPCATNTHHQFLHHENVYHRRRNFRVLCTKELFQKYPKLWVWGPVLPKLGTKIKFSGWKTAHKKKEEMTKLVASPKLVLTKVSPPVLDLPHFPPSMLLTICLHSLNQVW